MADGAARPAIPNAPTANRSGNDLVTSAARGGFTGTYGYDSRYYLVSAGHSETGTTGYGRDVAGDMSSRTVGASGMTSYTHDGQNRPNATAGPEGTPSVTPTHTKTGKLSSAATSATSRSCSYDANDNLSAESATVDGITMTTGNGYNDLDQLYARSGRVVISAPNALGGRPGSRSTSTA